MSSSDKISVIFDPDIFDYYSRKREIVEKGTTIQQIMDTYEWDDDDNLTRVTIGNDIIPRDVWTFVKPKFPLVIRRIPAGIELLAMMVLAAQAAAAQALTVASFGILTSSTIGAITATIGVGLGVGSVGGFIALNALGAVIGFGLAAGISMAVSAGLGALTKPQDQSAPPGVGKQTSPALGALGNNSRPNSPLPVLYGKMRVFPPYGASSFTIIRGEDTEIRALYLNGWGTIIISDERFGDTPATAFTLQELTSRVGDGDLTDVDLTPFNELVNDLPVSAPFNVIPNGNRDGGISGVPAVTSWVTVTSKENAREIGLDFSMTGIYFGNENGKPRAGLYFIEIQHKKVQDSVWIDSPALMTGYGGYVSLVNASPSYTHIGSSMSPLFRVQGQSTNPFLQGMTIKGLSGTDQYNVRVRRLEGYAGNARPGGKDNSVSIMDFTWTRIKTFAEGTPIRADMIPDLSTTAIRGLLKEFSQAGNIKNYNFIGERKLRIYDQGSGTTSPDHWDSDDWSRNPTIITRNPASALRDLLQGPACPRPRTDDQLDIPSFSAFWTECDEQNYYFDAYIDFSAPAIDQARDICRSAFADIDEIDGKITVILDVLQTVPKGLIVPRNSAGFSLNSSFVSVPHALKMQFVDEEEGYDSQGQLIVYDDGYGETSSGDIKAATLFEQFTIFGVTNRAQIWKHGRRRLREARLRPRTFTVSQDIEALTLRRGDMVLLAHDYALVGQHWGRIKKAGKYTLIDGLFAVPGEGWVEGTGAATLSVIYNPQTAVSGAAMRINTTGTGEFAVLDLKSLVYNSSDSIFLWVRVVSAASLSATDGFRIRIDTTGASGGYAEWRWGSDDLTTNEWKLVEMQLGPGGGVDVIPGNAYEVQSGRQFNPTNITAFTFKGNFSGLNGINRQFDVDQLFHVDYSSPSTVDWLEVDHPIQYDTGQDYRVQIRTVNTSTPGMLIHEENCEFLLAQPTPQQIYDWIYLSTPISANLPSADDIFTFGVRAQEIIECLVLSISRGKDLEHILELVDHAPEVYNEAAIAPTFDPGTTSPVPVAFRSPALPDIITVVSDESALKLTDEGSIVPRIFMLVGKVQGIEFKPPADSFQVQIRQSGTALAPSVIEGDPDIDVDVIGPWRSLAVYNAVAGDIIIINDVDEGSTYDIRIRAIAENQAGEWAYVYEHTVVGKTSAPPDVETFVIEGFGDAAYLNWTIENEPLDLAGVVIRHLPGLTATDWEQAVSLFSDNPADTESPDTVIPSGPVSIANSPRGDRTYLIRSIDKAGNMSDGVARLTVSLGDYPLINALSSVDHDALGYKNIRYNMSVASGDLKNASVGGIFWADGASLHWDQVNPLVTVYWGTVYFTGTYKTGRFMAAADLPAGIILEPTVTGPNWKIEYRVGTLAQTFSMDGVVAATGWNADNGTMADEAVILQEGTGSLKITSNNTNEVIVYADAPSFTNTLMHDAWIRVSVRIEDVTNLMTATDGFHIIIAGTYASGASVWQGRYEYGTDDGFVNATWIDIFADTTKDFDSMDTATQADVDWGDVTDVKFVFNTAGTPASSKVMYLDDVRLENWGPHHSWLGWPGKLDIAEDAFYGFRLTSYGGVTQGVVSAFNIQFDYPDVTQRIEDAVINIAGTTRLTLTETFREITHVTTALQDDAHAGFATIVMDKGTGGPPLTGGPLIEVRKQDNTLDTGLIDAVLIGY